MVRTYEFRPLEDLEGDPSFPDRTDPDWRDYHGRAINAAMPTSRRMPTASLPLAEPGQVVAIGQAVALCKIGRGVARLRPRVRSGGDDRDRAASHVRTGCTARLPAH
jgi:hypothetical protein